jgi:ABC-type multidrug transport system ATPase subunit
VWSFLRVVQGKELSDAVDEALVAVNLNKFRGRQVKKFSGGMKRRLSVACSLIGGTTVTFLDEPSTGLDPASRQNLWRVIQAAKQERSVVLTTHSMEEADILCDRIGIMDHGDLQCVGRAHQLKSRYGAGYTLVLTTSKQTPEGVEACVDFIQKMCPSASILNDPIAVGFPGPLFVSQFVLQASP